MSENLNPLLLEALRSRQGSAADPTVQALLAGMNSGSVEGTLPSAQELLGQLESTNPTLGLIAKYLAARQVNESQTDSADETEVDEVAARAAEDQRLALEQSDHLAQLVRGLERQVRKMRIELEQLRARNDTLAAALGACYLCWGEDTNCPVCRGSGGPGYLMPGKAVFAHFVTPAIRRLRVEREVDRSPLKNSWSDMSIQNSKSIKGDKDE
jgi:hypothetical protein